VDSVGEIGFYSPADGYTQLEDSLLPARAICKVCRPWSQDGNQNYTFH